MLKRPLPPHLQRENVCNVPAWPFSARRVGGEGIQRGSEGESETFRLIVYGGVYPDFGVILENASESTFDNGQRVKHAFVE